MSSLLPIQILVISLERSIERRARVEKEMAKISLPWTFLSAVDGSALKEAPEEYKSRKVRRLLGHDLTPNEIGCYLSHKEAWRRCVKSNLITLVFEDDFLLSPNFEEIIFELLRNQNLWGFVRLQGLYEVPYKEIITIADAKLVKNLGDAVGATAYILKPEIASALVKASVDIYEPADHFLEHHQKHGLEFLAIRPYPVDIRGVQSTIDDRTERSPLKGVKKHLRSIMRFLDRKFSKDPWFPK